MHDLFKWLLNCEGVYIYKIYMLEEVSWWLHAPEGISKVNYQSLVYCREVYKPQESKILKRPFKPQMDSDVSPFSRPSAFLSLKNFL